MPLTKPKGRAKIPGVQVSIGEIQRIAVEKNGKPLTLKQARAVQVYAATGNKTEAARQAYPNQTPAAQAQQGADNLKKPHIRTVLGEIMERVGITDDYLASRIKDGLKEADVNGNLPRYIELAAKLKGHVYGQSVNLSYSVKEHRETYGID